MMNPLLTMADETSQREDSDSTSVTEIRVGVWNVGHFALGKGTKSTIADGLEMLPRYQSVLQTIACGHELPDIMGTCEYSDLFALDTLMITDNTLMKGFPYSVKSRQFGYAYNNIFCQFKPKEGGAVSCQMPAGSQYRDYVWAKYDIDGREVMVICTHGPHLAANGFASKDDIHERVRKPWAAQMEQLIRDNEYVILMGDINACFQNIFEKTWIDDKGTTHYGYGWGHHIQDLTYPDSTLTFKDLPLTYLCGFGKKYREHYLTSKTRDGASMNGVDNIIVKGFEFVDYGYVKDFTLSDHPALGCILRFKDDTLPDKE